jgi:membrane protein DedA with SNARE-associated domain
MNELAHWASAALPWIQAYGYWAVALAVMLEGTGIPLPGTTLMVGASLLAGKGELNMPAVWLVSWLAAVSGDNLGYWIGRQGGRRLLLRTGVKRQRLARLEGFFRRFGLWLILLGRFVDGTRQLNGLIAGSARMPWYRFLLADLLGSAAWVSFWVIGLYYLDEHASVLHQWLHQDYLWAMLAIFLLLSLVLYLLFKGGDDDKGSPS